MNLPVTSNPSACILPTEIREVSLSLSDCLACSGCLPPDVPSISILESFTKNDVILLSPYAVSSLALKYNISVHYVFESIKQILDFDIKPLSSTLFLKLSLQQYIEGKKTSSSCPAWVSYLSKFIDVRLVDSTKSPHAILDELYSTSSNSGDLKKNVVNITSCHDKKVEGQSLGIDEFEGFLLKRGWNPSADIIKSNELSMENVNLIEVEKERPQIETFLAFEASKQGIILSNTDLLGCEHLKISFPRPDVKVYELILPGKNIKMAQISGFRNIQRFVRSEKEQQEYDFTEVLACSGGCYGGGAQVHPTIEGVDTTKGRGKKEWIKNMGGLFLDFKSVESVELYEAREDKSVFFREILKKEKKEMNVTW